MLIYYRPIHPKVYDKCNVSVHGNTDHITGKQLDELIDFDDFKSTLELIEVAEHCYYVKVFYNGKEIHVGMLHEDFVKLLNQNITFNNYKTQSELDFKLEKSGANVRLKLNY